MCRREWMTGCAAFCVRGSRWSTGRIARPGVDDQPEPQHLGTTAEPGSQFVQLRMREMEMAEEALVQGVRVRARAGKPGGNGRLPVAEDSLGGGSVQSFGQGRQHDGDPAREGVFNRYKGVLRRAVNVVRQA
jgi:hypothetical protein